MSIKESECYEGKKVGRLTLLYPVRIPKTKHNKKTGGHSTSGGWYCRCRCGKYKVRLTTTLSSGSSCGCGDKEHLEKLHQAIRVDDEHVKDSSPRSKYNRLWSKFRGMHRRCEKPNCKSYKNYGGRGIKVCDEWSNYETFKQWALDIGFDINNTDRNEQTIDRIDVNGNYEPGNCRFINTKAQNNNRRDNVNVTYQGKTQTLGEWSDELGIEYYVLLKRYHKAGWRGQKLFQPKIVDPKMRDRSIGYFEFKGGTTCLEELAEKYHLSLSTLKKRYKRGWRDDQLISDPHGTIYFLGEKTTKSNLAKKYNFKKTTIEQRYSRGLRDYELIAPLQSNGDTYRDGTKIKSV